jgi:hypothetical protein
MMLGSNRSIDCGAPSAQTRRDVVASDHVAARRKLATRSVGENRWQGAQD